MNGEMGVSLIVDIDAYRVSRIRRGKQVLGLGGNRPSISLLVCARAIGGILERVTRRQY